MSMKLQISLILIVILNVTALAQSVRVVKDITPGPESTFRADYVPIDDGIVASFKDKVLFVVKDNESVYSLWISNGEEDSTYIVHQLDPEETFSRFTNEDTSSVYYVVQSGLTRTLFAISKSAPDTSSLYTSQFEIEVIKYFNNEVFLSTDNKLIKINPETKDSEQIYAFGSFRRLRDMQVLNDKLIIIGGESNGTQLYSSDGTTEGTLPYFLLNEGNEGAGIFYMTTVDDKLYFFYQPDSEPFSLYVTDGTPGGTLPLTELRKVFNAPNLNRTRSIFGWNGRLYFKGNPADEPDNAYELYVSNGTVSNTRVIKLGGIRFNPKFFTPYKNAMYFSGDDFGGNFQIFKTTGLQATTNRAINPAGLGSGGSDFRGDFMAVHNDTLYFAAIRDETGLELWASAGNTATTRCLDLVPGPGSSVPSQMTSTDNYLFFMYESPEYGKELFVLDYTTVSTDEFSTAQVAVFPNPFKDYLTITFDENLYTELQVEIFNLEGKHVFQSTVLNNAEINLSSLPSGSYIVNLKNGNQVLSKTVIKH